jgi:hypothetical protein
VLGAVHIDIEMNSLEDAYLNIAREEERLLEDLYQPSYSASAHSTGSSSGGPRASETELPDLSFTSDRSLRSGGARYAQLPEAARADEEGALEQSFADYLRAAKHPTTATQLYANYRRRLI